MKLAVFGGTFNPVHAGHLQVAENVLRAGLAARVRFVPAHQPPHKGGVGLALGADRLEMLRRAVEGRAACEVSAIEIERAGPSYTADTLAAISAENGGARLGFILGSDNFIQVGSWARFEALLDLCEFLVVERPGYPTVFPPPNVPSGLRARLRHRPIPGPTLDVASSDLRRRLREGRDVSRWLPAPVLAYIRAHQLYATPNDA
ncbi:MAG: nicotinate (nicotinamide) nucleotide adenylyltransferase [Verrucomicrobiae bacterium]|nr:nicotinate (nicotinamide) nucleotide adenylyltransferase [Verrucomicrobiae bacterium]